MNNKDNKRAYISFHVKDFLSNKGISYENPQDIHISMEQINELCELFLDYLLIGERHFLGVDGWLRWIYGCLLERFYKSSKKYNGVTISDVPELQKIYRDVNEFKDFVKKHLGGELIDGEFKLH